MHKKENEQYGDEGSMRLTLESLKLLAQEQHGTHNTVLTIEHDIHTWEKTIQTQLPPHDQ
jgi:hypothetical protein